MTRFREKLLRTLGMAMDDLEFKDKAELDAFLDQFLDKHIDELMEDQGPMDDERAEDLVEASRNAGSVREAVGLLHEALALDPGCCDARVGLAHLESRTQEECLQRLGEAIVAEEARLGADFLKEHKGHFWGVLETRPYMRACMDRAQLLHRTGDLGEAQKAYRDLVILNPRDNQGVRYLLGPLCLLRGDLKGYRALRNKFKTADELELVWGDVLEAFLLEDMEGALAARAEAVERNGFMLAYLLGHRELPREMPGTYASRSREEAACAAFNLVPAWKAHPAALAWLKSIR